MGASQAAEGSPPCCQSHGAAGVFCCSHASALPCCAKARPGDSALAPQPLAYPDHAAGEQLVDFVSDPIHGPKIVAKDDVEDSGPQTLAVAIARQDGPEDIPSFAGGIEEEETYEDGSCFKGQLLEGRRHGCGAWTASNESYHGQWRNDHRDGFGRQVWKDERARRVYEGQFKAGNFDGHGRMEWHTPSGMMVYEGQYSNDLKHGAGRYAWPDGRVYDGQWRYGQRWGRATFTNSAGLKRKSYWREDKLERWVVEISGSANGDEREASEDQCPPLSPQ